MQDMNSVCLMGRLTRDPELRSTPSGLAVCSLRLAFSTSRKNAHTGDYEDKSNYVNVTVFGKRGETLARYFTKGKPIAIQGRLEWREWEAKDGGKRQELEVVADHWQFAGGDGDGLARQSSYASDVPSDFGTPAASAPAAQQAPSPQQQGFGVPSGAPADDDIPF